jgi:hypothetical protein
MESPQHRRTLVVLIAASSAFAMFMTTERCLADADRQNAVAMVQHLKASPLAPTIPAALEALYPQLDPQDIHWHALVTDNHYGFVRVTARLRLPAGPRDYVFDVSLTGNKLHPGNALAKELMENLKKTKTPQLENSGSRSPTFVAD